MPVAPECSYSHFNSSCILCIIILNNYLLYPEANIWFQNGMKMSGEGFTVKNSVVSPNIVERLILED